MAAMVAMMILCGCSQSIDEAFDANEMRFSAYYPTSSRATASAFEKGDAIGVYVTKYNGETAVPLELSGNYANNALTVFDGSTWKSTPTIYWEDGKFDVIAYYPYDDKPSSVDEYPFCVAIDQSTSKDGDVLGGYEKSDFLWATATGVSQMSSVPLVFSHKMSRVIINLVKGEDYTGDMPTDVIVLIHNTIPNSIIDMATGVVTVDGHKSAQTITARKESDSQYSAIVVPQRLETKRPLIELLVSDVSYLIESKFVFKTGTQHTINITLEDNPEQIKIELGGETISGWE